MQDIPIENIIPSHFSESDKQPKVCLNMKNPFSSNMINLTQNVNNITNIIINASSLETNKSELNNKRNYDSSLINQTKYTNSKENEINIKINNGKKNKDSMINSKQQHNQISISPIVDSIHKKLLTEDSNIDLNLLKKNSSSTSCNLKNERMSSSIFEDGIILPVHDFYDEFNREIILTDYFSRFLAVSIAIFEDELNENNLQHFKSINPNFNLNLNKSNYLSKEMEEYDNMRKKANINLTQDEKSDSKHHHVNVTNFLSHKNTIGVSNIENPLFNRQVQYREFHHKNIPERFRSQRIGKKILKIKNFHLKFINLGLFH